jgi:hypothetical protein
MENTDALKGKSNILVICQFQKKMPLFHFKIDMSPEF